MLDQAEPLNLWLNVRSLEEARRFYGQKLGLPLLREEPAVALHFGAGGIVLTMRAGAEPELPPRGDRLWFPVSANLDGLYEEMRRRGVVFEAPLADRTFGRSAMCRDPDGREIWICRPSAAETQFHHWQESRRLRLRRVPVQRRPTVRRHEPKPRSRRSRHPAE
jgi:catechol 2,3-dioxygenase-like lactoylglutathione lyase family enzyme